MNLLKSDQHGCPPLFLAPMEGLGDRSFRKAMASIGGFDQACTEFLRVPSNAHVESLARRYTANELLPTPLAAQLMGSDPELMAAMAQEVAKRGAPRIDLNCGCPSNTVTGRGAGSSLLKDPEHLHKVAKAMVQAVDIPVTAKLRSGYQDTSLFKENLLAAQESGICFLTLHPRTKADGYSAPARWDLIAEAKSILKIPVIGNGDILTVKDALNLLKQTQCDGIMIGRGSAINPWIFQEIRSHFSKIPVTHQWSSLENFFHIFLQELADDTLEKGRINKLKQVSNYLFKANEWLWNKRLELLTTSVHTAEQFLDLLLCYLKEGLKNLFEKEENQITVAL